MASLIYTSAKLGLMTGARDWETVAAMKMLLLEAVTSTPDNPDHEFVADIVADEFTDTGYTGGFGGAGRVALANRAATANTTDDRAELDFDNVVWTSLGGTSTAEFAHIVVEITNDAASLLISAHDIADQLTNGTDFTLTVGATGALHIT